MTSHRTSPLRALQERGGAVFMPYGPAAPDDAAPGRAAGVEMVETFGEYELEYAAIRKGVGILDLPQRGLIEVRGNDRLEFLNRLLNHDTRAMQEGEGRRAILNGIHGATSSRFTIKDARHRSFASGNLRGTAKPHGVRSM